MILTPTIHNTKIAQLIVNGECKDRGTFPAMKNLEKQYKMAGRTTHVGYAPFFKGTSYCKKCSDMVVNPYVFTYQGHQYYSCGKCQTINYVS